MSASSTTTQGQVFCASDIIQSVISNFRVVNGPYIIRRPVPFLLFYNRQNAPLEAMSVCHSLCLLCRTVIHIRPSVRPSVRPLYILPYWPTVLVQNLFFTFFNFQSSPDTYLSSLCLRFSISNFLSDFISIRIRISAFVCVIFPSFFVSLSLLSLFWR